MVDVPVNVKHKNPVGVEHCSTPTEDMRDSLVKLLEGQKCVKLGKVCEKVNKIKGKEQNPENEFLYLDISGIDNIHNKITEHKKYLMNRVKHANNRSNYQDLCNIIRRLIKIGGNKTAQEIIDYLKLEYQKRPAFMDELSKIKI